MSHAGGIRKTMVRGTVTGTIGRIGSTAVWFVITPLILSAVGDTDYGLWVLVGSLIAYGSLLDLGVASALTKYIAQYRTQGDKPSLEAVIATGFRLYLIIGAICFAMFLVVAVALPSLFNVPPADRPTATTLVVLMGTSLALSLAAAPATALLAGIERYDLYNTIVAAGSVLWAVASVVAVTLGMGIIAIVALNIPIIIAMRLISLAVTRRVAPDIGFRWGGASRAMARQLFRLSLPVFATQISRPLREKTDELVIGAFLTLSLVTPYALARRLSETAGIITNQFVRVLLPVASRLEAEQGGRLPFLYCVSTRVAMGIYIPIALALILLGDDIIRLWVGRDYPDAAAIVTVLTLSSLALISQYPAGAILQGIGRFRWIAVASLLAGVANLTLSLLLVRPLGVVGVAIGTFVPTLIEALGFVLPYTMRVLGIGTLRALREVWLPALVPALPCWLAIIVSRDVLGRTGFIEVAAASGLGVVVYAVVYLAFPAAHPERSALRTAGRALGMRVVRALHVQ